MKIYPGVWLAVIVLGVLLVFSVPFPKTSNPEVFTKISGKVFDKHTKKLVDSVTIEIRYGASGDVFLDTTLAQKDSFLLVFKTLESYAYDPFWYFVKSKNYYTSQYKSYWEYDSSNVLTLGKPSHSIHYFNPLSTVKIIPEKISQDSCGLFIKLIYPKKDTLEYEWRKFTDEFEEFPMQDCWLYEYDYMDKNSVKAYWTVDRAQKKDSFYKELKLIPFDTVALKIRY